MEQLLHVDGVASQNDTKGIRQLYDVIESNVRSLKLLGRVIWIIGFNSIRIEINR